MKPYDPNRCSKMLLMALKPFGHVELIDIGKWRVDIDITCDELEEVINEVKHGGISLNEE